MDFYQNPSYIIFCKCIMCFLLLSFFVVCLDEEEDFDSEESDEEGGKGEKKTGSAKKARMSVCDIFLYSLIENINFFL